ncbi:MAG: chaperone modulator CbpM [Niabella sp.]
MEDKKYISIDECCSYYSIETSFVQSLNERGLIQLVQQNEAFTIEYEQLSLLEKYMHMHYDLEVNLEGIEVISHLLEKVTALQAELLAIRNA